MAESNKRAIREIRTTFPFPVLRYSAKIKYNEVRKASGIADILLEIINSNVDSSLTVGDLLSGFGIPDDLLPIFTEELANLAGSDSGLVTTGYAQKDLEDPGRVKRMRMSEFAMTDKGRKMFKEKAVPTGKEMTMISQIAYKPVQRKHEVRKEGWTLNPLDSTPLGRFPGFKNGMDTGTDGLAEFVERSKTAIGLKREERIISMDPGEPEWFVERPDNNLTISLGADGATFRFATTDETAFFQKHYTPEMVKAILLVKNNYKFQAPVPDVPYADIAPDDIYIPGEYQAQILRPALIYLGTDKLGATRPAGMAIQPGAAEAEWLLGMIDPNAAFAVLDTDGCRYYCACNAAIPCPQYDGAVLEMQLLTANRLEENTLQAVLDAMYGMYAPGEITDTSCTVAAYIAHIRGSADILEKYAGEKLRQEDTADKKIQALMKLNQCMFAGIKAQNLGTKTQNMWKDVFERLGRELYSESAAQTQPQQDSIVYKCVAIEPLRRALGIQDNQFIRDITAGIKDSIGTISLYEALEKAGFGEMQIMSAANIIKPLMGMALKNEIIESATAVGHRCNNLRAAMWSLNGMLGINGYSGVITRDDYDADEFLNAYVNFNGALKELKKYRAFAEDEFKEVDAYLEIYEPRQEIIAIEKDANANPARITKLYIDDLIRKARWKEAVCDLLIRLTLDLVDRLDANPKSKAADLIAEANNAGYFTPEENAALHELRNLRNDYQHPERTSTIEVTRAKLENWEKIVFSIPGRDPGKDNKGKDNKQ